ncbi:MAG: helix-turn-helix domain-containing protein [Calditrichaeota bacterium]|nr:helix-turn-helix domain-containing protein [Calditrichota bacterium]
MIDLIELIRDSQGTRSLNRFLTYFNELTGINIHVINSYGEVVFSAANQQRKPLPCQIFQEDSHSMSQCREYRKDSCLEALRWGDAYISECPHKFIQIAVPILYNEKFIGGLVAAPLLMRRVGESFLKNSGHGKSFSKDKMRALKSALSQVPVIPEKRVKVAAELIFSIADFFSIPDLGLLTARRQSYREQAQVAEEIQRYKRNSDAPSPSLFPILNPKKEKELITLVRLGDKIGAKTILNEFLAQVMLYNPINLELMKAHVLELLAILTRAVVEEGANPESIFGLRYQFISELSDISDHQSLCFWVVKMMEIICDTIYQTRNQQHFYILEKACNYIRENYSEKVALETVAKHVFVSPFYLSHLFKDDLNTTFGEFLTKTRIEAAKALLRDTDLSLSQIALEVGYPDQSYFTKVFKKVERITPKTFRRLRQPVY